MWQVRKADSGKVYAAGDLHTVQAWCRDGRVCGDDLVRGGEQGDWQQAQRIFDLAAHLRRSRGPAPAVARSAAGAARPAGRAADAEVEPDLTSMMDMAFILVILLMVISTPAFQTGMDVKLPEAANVGAVDRKMDVSVTVSETGGVERISIVGLADAGSGRKSVMVDLAELAATLKPRAADISSGQARLILRADAKVTHGTVVKVMDTIRGCGIKDISIATHPRREPSK